MSDDPTGTDEQTTQSTADLNADGVPAEGARHGGPRSLDGVSSFMGLHWEDAQTVRMRIRPELINGGGLLSGVATYAMVDYCMGSTLWVQTAKDERIATISISINYIRRGWLCRAENGMVEPNTIAPSRPESPRFRARLARDWRELARARGAEVAARSRARMADGCP